MLSSACLSLFILGISAHTHIVVNGIAAWSSVQPMHACNKASLLIMLGLKHHRIHLPMFMLVLKYCRIQYIHIYIYTLPMFMLVLKRRRIHLPMLMLVLKYCRIQYIYYQCSCWCSNIVTYIYQLPALCNEAGPHIIALRCPPEAYIPYLITYHTNSPLRQPLRATAAPKATVTLEGYSPPIQTHPLSPTSGNMTPLSSLPILSHFHTQIPIYPLQMAGILHNQTITCLLWATGKTAQPHLPIHPPTHPPLCGRQK